MRIAISAAALALTAACALPADAQPPVAPLPDAPVSAFLAQCEGKDEWNDPAPPFHIYGSTYGVGTCGMNALLVADPEGLILVDVGTQEAAQLVAENIRRLGFRLEDVKWIVASHEHWDHVGGIAEMQRLTGAKVAALASAKDAFEQGRHNPIDPQGEAKFPKIRVDRVLADGDKVSVGASVLTIHATPAHSPGSSSWTWQSCEGSSCKTIAYADSATTISSDEYRFSDHPDYVANVWRGLDAIRALPCDILITPHPSASAMRERLAGGTMEDSAACRTYADQAKARFSERLESEKNTSP
ncbi:hypothetical protein SZ64_06600 [Erythrobacter sp. SG61-1L]|uniref:subclass B3 metallo-beta-lactamase n=1 Tax=Erythrobacter sp. SG61-1L TaxID=1603897 RepID=UPI0006D6C68B|nr:subclass B3 metallo-beta-lactamase [Erythrobacter sp. SG61-1L]KPL67812.1 hypothetical protein SZ64_06600 [Erythrobacter sp. SG61-1L]